MSVTGGDISSDGTEMLVKHREAVYYYPLNDTAVLDLLSAPGFELPYIVEPQGEAICWSADSMAYFTLSEGVHQPLYKYTRVTA